MNSNHRDFHIFARFRAIDQYESLIGGIATLVSARFQLNFASAKFYGEDSLCRPINVQHCGLDGSDAHADLQEYIQAYASFEHVSNVSQCRISQCR